jgi:hypothetical protein
MALEDATSPMKGLPGKYAKRDDLGYKSQSYGDGVAYEANKKAVPLAKSPSMPAITNAAGDLTARGKKVTGLYDYTERPNEPISSGVDIGDGVGSSALAMKPAVGKLSDTLAVLLPYDTTGEISVLYQNALSRGQ